jgi:hypothetical protein
VIYMSGMFEGYEYDGDLSQWKLNFRNHSGVFMLKKLRQQNLKKFVNKKGPTALGVSQTNW